MQTVDTLVTRIHRDFGHLTKDEFLEDAGGWLAYVGYQDVDDETAAAAIVRVRQQEWPFEAAVTIPSAQYVERGVCASPDTSCDEWAATFRLLGGLQCTVPAYGAGIPDTMTVLFLGSQEAFDFLMEGLTA